MNNDGKFMRRQGLNFAKLVPFLLIVALATACGTSISVDEDSVEVTVPLSESAVNRLLRYSFVDQDVDNLFDDITSIDMQPGLIRMFGTYTHSDGSTVPGSADLTMSAKDGALDAEITAVDIAGLDIDHPRVTHINDVMADAFAEEASDDVITIGNDQAEFVSVEITEDGMEITIRVPRQ
jgi:hypothetical protein